MIEKNSVIAPKKAFFQGIRQEKNIRQSRLRQNERDRTMDKKRAIALILAAAGLQCLAGCGKNKNDSMPLYAETPVETTTEPPVGGADISGDNYDSEAYQNKITEHIQAAELTDAPLVLGSIGKDVITP